MSLPTLPPIDVLNNSDKESFTSVVNILFETAPPLGDPLYTSRPFKSYDDLISQAQKIIQNLPFEDKIVVVNAHPRIGLDPKVATLSALSYIEQGLDKERTALSDEEKKEIEEVFARLKELNDQYETKFGFKFVEFVAGRPKKMIIPVLEARLQNDSSIELEAGLDAMIAIAHDRLSKLQLNSHKM